MAFDNRLDPYCVTPYYLAFDSLPDEVPALDRHLLHVLVSCSGIGWADRSRIESVVISPGVKRLASQSRLDGRTIQRGLNRLAEKRLVLIVESTSRSSGSQNNGYIVTPKAFVLHAEKLALASAEEMGPEDRVAELQRIGDVSRALQHDLAELDRLPGRTTWRKFRDYERNFAELKRRLVEFQNQSEKFDGALTESAGLDHDCEPGGGMAQSHLISILKDPDLKISEIESFSRDLKISKSILILRFFINNKKILFSEWMESKSARACVIDEARVPVNTEATDSPKITPQVVSIAKDLQQNFGSWNGFLDWDLLNRWIAKMLAEKGLDYTLDLAAWTDRLFESRDKRPLRLSPTSLKTLAQMFESEQNALKCKKNIAPSFDDHSCSSDNSNGKNTPRCET